LVGLIIGRQGENLRRVEAETGCRVQFITGPDETGPYRQCKVTGSRSQRAAAKAEINRIIDDSGMAGNSRAAERPRDTPASARASSHQPALRDGEDSMQIMVPDRTVGLIIGRGGETIRDLQERSGCHVNIVGEQKSVNGLRPVNLIGSREAAAKAKDLIMEIVESDSKGTASKDRAPQRDTARDSGYGAHGGGGNGDKINDSIFVPSEAVGMIIGKGGETIKEMQSTTSCKINVSQSSGPGEVEREIGLIGTREAIAAAKRAIEDKVDAVV
jgi:far upstream element-binding protein